MARVFLITGASRGFGKIWAEALLERGEKVAVTARNLDSLSGLVSKYGASVFALTLDVSLRYECVAAVKRVKEHFGRIDVLINNAGFGLLGAIEETSEQEARRQMDTNFFGVLWMTQAVIPIMRAQKSGHIIQVSSYLGLITLPVLGLYNASKFALEGLSETLASEIKSFNIHVSLIEPNGFATDWSGVSAVQTHAMPEYTAVKKAFREKALTERYGIPAATAGALLRLVDSPNPPLRLLLGNIAYPEIKRTYEERLASFEAWKEVSNVAHAN